MLTQILQLRRLHDQLINLVNNIQLLVILKITTCELLLHAIENLDGSRVLAFDFWSAAVGLGDAGGAVCAGARACLDGWFGSVEEFGGGDVAVEDGLATGADAAGHGHGGVSVVAEVGACWGGGVC